MYIDTRRMCGLAIKESTLQFSRLSVLVSGPQTTFQLAGVRGVNFCDLIINHPLLTHDQENALCTIVSRGVLCSVKCVLFMLYVFHYLSCFYISC